MGIFSRLFGRKAPGSALQRTDKMAKLEGLDLASLAVGEFKVSPKTLLPVSWSNRPRWPVWDSESAIDRAFKASSWVYICAMRNANAIASLPWRAEIWTGQQWAHVPNHPLQDLIDQPNPFWSRQHLMTLIVLELELTGNSVLCKVRAEPDGAPVNVFTIRPQRIAPIPSRDIHVLGYEVRAADGKPHFLGAADAIHVQFPDPANPFWGLSPLQSAAKAIEVDRESAAWQRNALSNMLVPPGVFAMRGHITKQQFEDAKEILREQYQEAANARRPLMTGPDVEWRQLSMSPAELDFLETRKLTREEICSVFGVPPPVAGILERATYSNIETARTIWWQDTLLPLVDMIAGALTRGLASEFGDNFRLVPDLTAVPAMLTVVERRVAIIKDLFSMGVPFNTASEAVALGLSSPGGDIGYLPANLSPVTEGGPLDMYDAPIIGPNDEAKRFRGRKSRVVSIDEWRDWLDDGKESKG